MKKIFVSIGFIVVYMAIHFGIQFWYIFSVAIIIGVIKGFEAGLAGNLTPDPEQINLAVQETMRIHLPIALIFSAVLAALIYYFICRGRKQNIIEVCSFNRTSVKSAAIFLFSGVVMLFFNGSLNTLIYESGYLKDSFQQLESTFAPFYEGNFLLSLISISIFVPLIEEIMFRGLIQSELRKHMSVAPAVLIQAILFGLYHMNLIQLIITVLMGIFLGFLTVWTKSILGAIIIHSVNNAFSFFLAWFEPETAQEHNLLISYIMLVTTTLILTGVMLYFFKNKEKPANPFIQTNEISV